MAYPTSLASEADQIKAQSAFFYGHAGSMMTPELALKFQTVRNVDRKTMDYWKIFKSQQNNLDDHGDTKNEDCNVIEPLVYVNESDKPTSFSLGQMCDIMSHHLDSSQPEIETVSTSSFPGEDWANQEESEEELDVKPEISELERCLEWFQSTTTDPTKGPLYSTSNLVLAVTKAVIMSRGAHRCKPTTIVYDGVDYNVRKLNLSNDMSTVDNNNYRTQSNQIDKLRGITRDNMFIGVIGSGDNSKLVSGSFEQLDKRRNCFNLVEDVQQCPHLMCHLIEWCVDIPAEILVKYFRYHFRTLVVVKTPNVEIEGVTFICANLSSFIIDINHIDLYCNGRFELGQIVTLDFNVDKKVIQFVVTAFSVGSFDRTPSFNYDQMIQYLKLVDILGFSSEL